MYYSFLISIISLSMTSLSIYYYSSFGDKYDYSPNIINPNDDNKIAKNNGITINQHNTLSLLPQS